MSRKRWREDSVLQSSSDISTSGPQPKRQRLAADPFESFSHSPASPTYTSSPSSIASSPASIEHTSFSPMPSLPPSRDLPVFAQGNALSNIFDFISTGKTSVFEPGGGLESFSCGFCSDNTPCVCRELALQSANERYTLPMTSLKVEHAESRPVDMELENSHQLPQASPQQTSILDNLPAYQPPVPLRRRANAKSSTNSIFPVSHPAPTVPTCTGDPSNCPACADDAFGKAFCAAISKSVASNGPCDDCPSRTSGGGCCSSSGKAACCGNPAACGQGREISPSSPTPMPASPQPIPPSTDILASAPGGTIPCDDAWRQIKSHPNVAFADLDLLADVVARRSKCTGPRVEIFPAPGTITPERELSPPTVPSIAGQVEPGASALPTAGPSTGYPGIERDRARGSPSLQLVPQEILVQCGRRRVREVNADGVRDALRLLDLKFALS